MRRGTGTGGTVLHLSAIGFQQRDELRDGVGGRSLRASSTIGCSDHSVTGVKSLAAS
jgi:hypothetical protein